MPIREFPDTEIASLLPFPDPESNKYTRGFLEAIGGSSSYPGAICMASKAAYTVGAGYVETVSSKEALPLIRSYDPEVVARDWKEWDVSSSRISEAEAGHPCACLMGSGLDPEDPGVSELLASAMAACVHPVIIDAGAITWLASEQGRVSAEKRAQNGLSLTVTPHMGEAARLARPVGIDMPDGREEGDEALAAYARAISDAYGAVVVLKGPDTYIASPGGRTQDVAAMRIGTAALAKAGTGDVLAGMVSGLTAQGIDPFDAAVLAATLHARAGIEASEVLSEICIGAPDVIAYIPAAVRYYAGLL